MENNEIYDVNEKLADSQFHIGKYLCISNQKLTRFDLILLKTFQEQKKQSISDCSSSSRTSSLSICSSSEESNKIFELGSSLEQEFVDDNLKNDLKIPNNLKNGLWTASSLDFAITEEDESKKNKQILELIEEFKLRRLEDLKQLEKLCGNKILKDYLKKPEQDSGSESSPGVEEEGNKKENQKIRLADYSRQK